jgi:asparagine N-glycosylation enzyme membrane subunit Stt3
LGPNAVVASWWDYGYWLGLFGNVTTLCDNATVNGTQIENVGYAMMAPENQSLRMLKTYDADYLLVFVTIQLLISADQTQIAGVQFGGYGDEGKWVWMARISGGAAQRLQNESFMNDEIYWTNETFFGNTTLNEQTQQNQFTWNEMGLESTIFKLMSYAEQEYANRYGLTTPDQAGAAPTYFTPEFISGLEVTPQDAATAQYGLLVPLVCLYKINWDAYEAANAAATP